MLIEKDGKCQNGHVPPVAQVCKLHNQPALSVGIDPNAETLRPEE